MSLELSSRASLGSNQDAPPATENPTIVPTLVENPTELVKEPYTRTELTDDEIDELKAAISGLDAHHFMKVVELVHETCPDVQDSTEGIDLDRLPGAFLAVLKAIVESAGSAQEAAAIDASTTDQQEPTESNPLKRKRPTVEEQNRRLKELREELARLQEQSKTQPSNSQIDDEDDDDEDEEDEDMSSEVSEGDDLNEDLDSALESNFNFKGNFYHASNSSSAPNPGLFIDGLGEIGLPLSPRDAQHIKAVSSQAPYGHGTAFMVNKEVRDTWEIEPHRVFFTNPAWKNWMDETVVPTVWNSLVGSVMQTKPKCELYKLLLYEEGSHFHAHKDTQKEPGMFATIIIVLPSRYTGGQIHLSHASSKKVIDFAANSMFGTSVLSWYTDVTHEVKPVISGWRLALSFNLVNKSNALLPSLPNKGEAEQRLLHVLKKWYKGGYDDADHAPSEYIAYLLDHEYSESELKRGEACLKGRDAHRLQHIQEAAEEAGYVICLGSLEHHVTGDADEEAGCGYGYGSYGRGKRRRGWYNGYDEDEETPGMGEIYGTETSLQNVVDLDGFKGRHSLDVDVEHDLIPRNPFEDESPDDEEYEGYMGNYPGNVEHWYRRTVMILVHSDNASSVLGQGMGIYYPRKKFEQAVQASNPTDASYWALYLVPFVKGRRGLTDNLIRHALDWRDGRLWRKVMEKLPLEEEEERLMQGWRLFGHGEVLQLLENKLSNMKRLPEKQALIVFARDKDPALQAWCSEQMHQIFRSVNAETVIPDDIPAVLQYALEQHNGELWKKMMRKSVLHTEQSEARIDRGWATLGFSAISSVLDKKLWNTTGLKEKRSLIEATLRKSNEGEKSLVETWCSAQMDVVIHSLKAKSVDSGDMSAALELALEYRDKELWKKVVPELPNHYNQGDDKLKLGWAAFGFDTVSSFFEKKITTAADLKARQDLIEDISFKASETDRAVVDEWCSRQLEKAFRSLKPPSTYEVPFYVSVCRSKGIQFAKNIIIPQFQKMSNMKSFWIAFIKALYKERASLSSAEDLASLIENCFDALIPQWSAVTPSAGYGHYGSNVVESEGNRKKVTNVIELLGLCLSTSQPNSSKKLLSLVLRNLNSATNKQQIFTELYGPLIKELRTVLRKHGKDLTEQPFAGTVQYLVGQYLRQVLGPAPSIRTRASRKVGCGCVNCGPLDQFMLSATATQTFRYNQTVRTHLEKRLLGAQELVTWTTVRSGTPHGIAVTKKKEVIDGQRWAARKKAAKTFFDNIGDNAMLAKVLGEAFADFERAFDALPSSSTGVVPNPSQIPVQGQALRGSAMTNARTTAAPSTEFSSNAPPSKSATQRSAVVIDLTSDA